MCITEIDVDDFIAESSDGDVLEVDEPGPPMCV